MTALITTLISTFTRFATRTFCTPIPDYKKLTLPLPSSPHLSIDDCKINNRNLLVIGDVHGCLDELNDLIDQVNKEYGENTYLPIFVGDIVNKGPKSIETLHKIRTMDHLSVRGNHDEAVLRQYLLANEETGYCLPEKYKWVKQLTKDDVEYLKELPYTITIKSFNAVVVHAGLVPYVSLSHQKKADMIVMRNLIKTNDESYRSEENLENGQAWASVWPGPDHVFFGHDARRKLQLFPFATGLDTGCLYGFTLTGVIVDQSGKKEFIRIPAKKVYVEPTG